MKQSLVAMGRYAFCGGAIVGIWLGSVLAQTDWPFWVSPALGFALGFGVPQFIIKPIAGRMSRPTESRGGTR